MERSCIRSNLSRITRERCRSQIALLWRQESSRFAIVALRSSQNIDGIIH
jgi:hypothetical protein